METVNSENSIHNDIINLQDLTEWKLFAEGNANFLFNYIGKDPQFQNQLLRLRKYKTSTYTSTLQIYNSVNSVFKPFFKNDIHGFKLVLLSIEKIELLNQYLSDISNSQIENENENTKIKPRDESKDTKYYLQPNELYGLLIPNLRPSYYQKLSTQNNKSISIYKSNLISNNKSIVIEFKPKWLIQSPNAPSNSKYCRTCALNLKKGKKYNGYCPLKLSSLNLNEFNLKQFINYLLNDYDDNDSNFFLKETLFNYFYNNNNNNNENENENENENDDDDDDNIFQKILKIQLKDSKGILNYLNENELDDDFLMSMTIRDVSLFIQIDYNLNDKYSKIITNLVDIDIKNKEKFKYWKSIEESLIDEGWYTKLQNNWPSCFLT